MVELMIGLKRLILLFVFFPLSIYLFAADPVQISHTNLGNGTIELYCENKAYYPAQVLFRFTELTGLETTAKQPFYFISPPKTKKLMLTLKNIPGKFWNFHYDYKYYAGDPVSSSPDTNWVYLLPFRHGTKMKVIQGYDGKVSHSAWQSYSVDFNLPEGTEIFAARGGTVVDTKDDSDIGGWDESFAKYGNYILVLHDDGSFASYYHLQKNGSLVKPGDKITAGQLIGYSGNTGRSDTPHLHFMVYRPIYTNEETFPTLFATGKPNAEYLQEGRYYYSYHPGGEPFSVELGDSISEDQLENTNFSPVEGKFNVLTRQIDDTVLFFASNGLSNNVTLLVIIDLTNMRYTKEKPYTGTINGNSGRFLFLIRPEDPSRPSSYYFRWKYWNKK